MDTGKVETKRIYYEDVYRRECQARVLSCQPVGNGYKVVLDQTVFYPEGGGQPADHGFLVTGGDGGPALAVTDVQEEEGRLVHYVSSATEAGNPVRPSSEAENPVRPITEEENSVRAAIEEGSFVRAVIDWNRRFDLMQQHSGEHIVSGMIHSSFGYDNVGFHMGEDCITIDLSGRLTMEEARQIEEKVNAYILGCHGVEVLHPQGKDLDQYDYRSKKELEGDVRLVEFPGADLCACCGLHVRNTGEIGLVKILSCHHFREGVRIEMLSGKRAFDYLDMHFVQNSQIGVALSVQPDKTMEAVARLQREIYELRGALIQEKRKATDRLAASCQGKENVFLFAEGLDPVDVRKCADGVLDRISGICLVFSGDDEKGWHYAAGIREGDIRPLIKEMNTALSGRGGGKPVFAQGVIKASREEIVHFMEEKGFEQVSV